MTAANHQGGFRPQAPTAGSSQQHNAKMITPIVFNPINGGLLPVWEYEIGDTTYYHPLSGFIPTYEGSWDKETILAVFEPAEIAVLTRIEQVEANPVWLEALKTGLDGAIESSKVLLDDAFGIVGNNQIGASPALRAGNPYAISSMSQLSAPPTAGTISGATHPMHSLHRTHKRTVSQVETEDCVEIKKLRQTRIPSSATHPSNPSFNGGKMPALYDKTAASDSQVTDALRTLPSSQVDNFFDPQKLGFDDMLQCPDIDDVIASALTEDGISISSKNGPRYTADVRSPTASGTASQCLDIDGIIASVRRTHGMPVAPKNGAQYTNRVWSSSSSGTSSQAEDIDDIIAEAQRRSKMPVNSTARIQTSARTPNLTASGMVSHERNCPPRLPHGTLHPQQAPQRRRVTMPETRRFASPGRLLDSQQEIARRHTLDSLHNITNLSRLNHSGATSRLQPKTAFRVASTTITPFDQLPDRSERLGSLPPYDMWSKYLCPEGFMDLFVPFWRSWQRYLSPEVIMSLLTGESASVAKPQEACFDRQ
ncbi:MAG: hypothetical protein Q9191_003577 [Dirinaria sp. TL-2023a]